MFPLITSYWSQASAKISYIGQRLGGMDKLRAKRSSTSTTARLTAKKPCRCWRRSPKKYGFELVNVEVPAPGTEQQSQWLKFAASSRIS